LLLGLLFVWLSISTYFYFQHRVTVQVMQVPGWSLDDGENQGVLVKEIRVYEWEKRRIDSWERWKPVLELTNKLPGAIRIKYYRFVGSLIYFYTDLYQKVEDGAQRVEVIRLFLKEYMNEPEDNNHPKHPKVRAYSDGQLFAGLSRGFGNVRRKK